jgi:hypothetical protein
MRQQLIMQKTMPADSKVGVGVGARGWGWGVMGHTLVRQQLIMLQLMPEWWKYSSMK